MRQNFQSKSYQVWVAGLVVGAFMSAPALAADYFIDASYPRTDAVNDGSDYVQINFKIQSYKCNEANPDGTYSYSSSSSISCPNDGTEGSSLVPRYGISIYPQTQLTDSFFDRSYYSSDFSGIFRMYIRSTALGDPAPSLYRDSDRTQLAIGPLGNKVSFNLPTTPAPTPIPTLSPTPFMPILSTQNGPAPTPTPTNLASVLRSVTQSVIRNAIGAPSSSKSTDTVLGSSTERAEAPQPTNDTPLSQPLTANTSHFTLIPAIVVAVLAGIAVIIYVAFYWIKRRSQ